MSTATLTPTVTLIHAVAGIVAEVTDLPIQIGPVYVRNLRLSELACEALRAKYPELKVISQSVDSETAVVLVVERI